MGIPTNAPLRYGSWIHTNTASKAGRSLVVVYLNRSLVALKNVNHNLASLAGFHCCFSFHFREDVVVCEAASKRLTAANCCFYQSLWPVIKIQITDHGRVRRGRPMFIHARFRHIIRSRHWEKISRFVCFWSLSSKLERFYRNDDMELLRRCLWIGLVWFVTLNCRVYLVNRRMTHLNLRLRFVERFKLASYCI